jgi:tRNA 5-methylaminomethyl-2-thiouridine biosynthesis bifunctional protein
MTQPPRSVQFDDVYFSADGGPEETCHVFLDGNNLPQAWQDRERFTIGETGFGTGLNFLLAWELFERTAPKDAFLDFVSVEKFPLSVEEIRQGLSPWADRLSPYLDKMLDQYPMRVPGFHRMVFDNRVALTLIFDDANDAFPEIYGQVDAWFLDGFTPSKNPDMWTDTLFQNMARLSHEETSFATFTAAGFVKRGLQTAGFSVEKKKGFGRKRDMMVGRFTGVAKRTEFSFEKNITIYGAGLAGTACAYVLKQYGFTPALYDPNGIATGASGNETGLINPRFTAFRTADSDFYTAAFAHTVRTFPHLAAEYDACGSLHLITDEDKDKRLSRTANNWGWHSDHMRLLSAEEASDVAGIALDKDCLYLPQSARINPAALCRAYAQDVEVRSDASELKSAPVILANGIGAKEYVSWLPIHTVRGQIAYVREIQRSAALKANLCYGGYIAAGNKGVHAIGATFQKWLSHTDILDEDNQAILDNLKENVPELSEQWDVIGARAGLRTASQDRFPIVGMANGYFVTTAHGSHGIGSSLMAAHLLADFLRGGIKSLGSSTISALAPQRFLARAARKAGTDKAID